MTQTETIKRIEEICKEFDARVIEVGLPIARLELAKALTENETESETLRAATTSRTGDYGELLVEWGTQKSMIRELHNKLVLYSNEIEAAAIYIDYNETAADSYVTFRANQSRHHKVYQQTRAAREEQGR